MPSVLPVLRLWTTRTRSAAIPTMRCVQKHLHPWSDVSSVPRRTSPPRSAASRRFGLRGQRACSLNRAPSGIGYFMPRALPAMFVMQPWPIGMRRTCSTACHGFTTALPCRRNWPVRTPKQFPRRLPAALTRSCRHPATAACVILERHESTCRGHRDWRS